VGLLAALLTVTSPFFLMNSGSLLSHPLGLVLSAAFVMGWLDAFDARGGSMTRLTPASTLAALAAAFSLGLLILTRPMTALAICLPFCFHGIYLLWRGDRVVRWRLVMIVGIILGFTALHFLWQYALTGNPLLNPYTLWWPYDRVGFGPGHGVSPEGNTIEQAWFNTRDSLRVGAYDLFGWGKYSWIFLPFGLLATRRNGRAWLIAAIVPSLVLVYLAYWIGASLFGPRYYYEGLFSLTLISAAGIAWFAGWPVQPGEDGGQRTEYRVRLPSPVSRLVLHTPAIGRHVWIIRCAALLYRTISDSLRFKVGARVNYRPSGTSMDRVRYAAGA
jgi:hypothetical protein